MKRLVIVRHGSYDVRDGRLDADGMVQIRKLSEALKKFGLGSAVLLTSTAPRASDSAAIVGEVLGVTPQEHPVLWSGGEAFLHIKNVDELWSIQGVLDLIRRHEEADTVILVAHLESAEEIPHPFGLRFLGVDTFPKGEAIGKGTAWLIDCTAKTCTHIRP